MSDATTSPSQIIVLQGETLPLGIDLALLLAAGQTLSSPTSALRDITNGSPGTVVTLAASPSIAGTIVTQSVAGLTPGHTYRLVLGATAVAGTVWQAGVTVVCPF